MIITSPPNMVILNSYVQGISKGHLCIQAVILSHTDLDKFPVQLGITEKLELQHYTGILITATVDLVNLGTCQSGLTYIVAPQHWWIDRNSQILVYHSFIVRAAASSRT